MRQNKTARCSYHCKVSEGLLTLGRKTSGLGLRENRVQRSHPFISAVDQLAIDMCQIDDFVVAVAVAVLQDAGKRVEVYSRDGRFQLPTLQLPRIRYPFFMVVQTHDSTVGVPVYQKDSSVLNSGSFLFPLMCFIFVCSFIEICIVSDCS